MKMLLQEETLEKIYNSLKEECLVVNFNGEIAFDLQNKTVYLIHDEQTIDLYSLDGLVILTEIRKE
jgi:hypothetical protein